MNTLVVNLFGGPGTCKSTGAAYIFSQLKLKGIDTELVTEFAKDKVWEKDVEVFKNQAYLFGKQSFRQTRCDGQVQVIVTDSPLPLSIIYNKDSRLTENFNLTVLDMFNSFTNFNIFLKRVKEYNPNGRFQTEAESDELSLQIKNMLETREIPYVVTEANIEGYNYIVETIIDIIEKGDLY